MHGHHTVHKSSMLHEDFGDMQRAACYLALGLAQAFPDAEVEVTLHMGRAAPPRTLRTTTSRLEPIVERFARRFPSHLSEVLYDPERKDGVVGVVRCACPTDKRGRTNGCPLQCKDNADKPQVVVRLLNVPAA